MPLTSQDSGPSEVPSSHSLTPIPGSVPWPPWQPNLVALLYFSLFPRLVDLLPPPVPEWQFAQSSLFGPLRFLSAHFLGDLIHMLMTPRSTAQAPPSQLSAGHLWLHVSQRSTERDVSKWREQMHTAWGSCMWVRQAHMMLSHTYTQRCQHTLGEPEGSRANCQHG